MSYDLTIYFSKKGFPDPAEVREMDKDEEEAFINPPVIALPKFDRNTLACAPILNEMEKELPVEVDVFSDRRISIHFPYWFDEKEATDLFSKIDSYLKKLAECGGYFVYDPQTNEAFDPKVTTLKWNAAYEKGRGVIRDLELGKTEINPITKKPQNISEGLDTWSVANGDRLGNPLVLRFRTGVKDNERYSGYPFQISVAVPLLHPNEQKLPGNEESVQLNSIEESLVNSLTQGDETIFVMVITTAGVREFIFYARWWQPEYFENKIKEIEKFTEGHQLQFMMDLDQNWETFDFFVHSLTTKKKTTLKEDIDGGSQWISEALKSSGYNADFSPESLTEIDRFFDEQSKNGKATPGSLLAGSWGNRIFCIGAYIGEVIRKKIGGEWITDDADPQGEMNITLKIPSGVTMWPVQRAARRFYNGPEDSIAWYGRSIGLETGLKIQGLPKPKESFLSLFWDVYWKKKTREQKITAIVVWVMILFFVIRLIGDFSR